MHTFQIGHYAVDMQFEIRTDFEINKNDLGLRLE